MFKKPVLIKFNRRLVLPLFITALIITLARIVYSGWYTPLVLIPMFGDGITMIFSGIDGYFLYDPLRTLAGSFLNHPYVSVLFYYSIFHPICSTGYLGIVLIALTHLSVIIIIMLSVRMFPAPRKKIIFLLLLTIVIFNWGAFYDGVAQGFPAHFMEVLGITVGFWLFLAGHGILAGIIFGFTSTIKILPVIFLGYFIYKKQYRLVFAAVFTSVILSAIILYKENIHLKLVNIIFKVLQSNAAYDHSVRDAGLNSFMHFIFHQSFKPFLIDKVHYVLCIFLVLFFIFVERKIVLEKNKYLFGFAAVSIGMFQISPHISEMYWYILLFPALIFNVWMLLIFRDKLFTFIVALAYIFLHGFSAINIFFRILSHMSAGRIVSTDLYNLFNVHGGAFVGPWLIYFSTYGLALKYLVVNKK